MGSLNSFIDTVNNYGVRTQNLFGVKISLGEAFASHTVMSSLYGQVQDMNLGRIVGQFGKKDGANLWTFAQGFTIPSKTITYSDVNFQGFPVSVPSAVNLDKTHSITFNDDMRGILRRIFNVWQNAFVNGDDGTSFESHRFQPSASGASTRQGEPHVLGEITVFLLDNSYSDLKTTSKEIPSSFSECQGLFNDGLTTSLSVNPVCYKFSGVSIESVEGGTFSSSGTGVSTFGVRFRSQFWNLSTYKASDLEALFSDNDITNME